MGFAIHHAMSAEQEAKSALTRPMPIPMSRRPTAEPERSPTTSTSRRKGTAAQSSPGTRQWLHQPRHSLAEATDHLTPKQWEPAQVTTAQGGTVRATETPWVQAPAARVHAVDLDTRINFTDLPAGDLPHVAAWLSGRPYDSDALADAPRSARGSDAGHEGP